MLRYLNALVLLFLLFYTAILYGSISLALLAMTGAVFLVCSFLYLLAEKRQTEANLCIPIGIAEEDRTFFVQLTAKSGRVLPPEKLRAKLGYGTRGSKHQRELWMPVKNARFGEPTDAAVKVTLPGDYVFALKSVRIYDLTGWFYLTKRCKKRADVLVLPRPAQLPADIAEQFQLFGEDEKAYDRSMAEADLSEFFDVRPFRNGDRLKNIHWKLSAKEDELIVKEHAAPNVCPVVCFFPGPGEKIPQMLSLIAGISCFLMEAKCQHYAVWMSEEEGDVRRMCVDSEESYYLFLATFLRDAGRIGADELRYMYRQKYKGEQWLHEISLDEKTGLMIDEKQTGFANRICSGIEQIRYK